MIARDALATDAGPPVEEVGTDLCDVERMRLAVERTGERFLRRVFTPAEREQAAEDPAREAAELARRFAVKESVFKVLGRGWPKGVGFDEIELVPPRPGEHRGLSTVRLTGRAAERARLRGLWRLVACATDDGALAFAVVIAEGRPPGWAERALASLRRPIAWAVVSAVSLAVALSLPHGAPDALFWGALAASAAGAAAWALTTPDPP